MQKRHEKLHLSVTEMRSFFATLPFLSRSFPSSGLALVAKERWPSFRSE
jgi:hypothetical protein